MCVFVWSFLEKSSTVTTVWKFRGKTGKRFLRKKSINKNISLFTWGGYCIEVLFSSAKWNVLGLSIWIDQPYILNFCFNEVTGRHYCQVLQCLSALGRLKMYEVGILWRLVHASPPKSCVPYTQFAYKNNLIVCFTIGMSLKLYPKKSTCGMLCPVEDCWRACEGLRKEKFLVFLATVMIQFNQHLFSLILMTEGQGTLKLSWPYSKDKAINDLDNSEKPKWWGFQVVYSWH